MTLSDTVSPAAAAKTVTLHFFSKQVYTRISDASGHPLSPNAAPAGSTTGPSPASCGSWPRCSLRTLESPRSGSSGSSRPLGRRSAD